MNPRDFLALAVRLAQGPTAEIRTSIGRSYYAAFNAGAEILRSLGFRVGRGAAAHGEVMHCFANCGDQAVATVADNLSLLHTLRNRADYQMDKVDVERRETALEAATRAALAIQLLDTAFTGPQRDALRQSIHSWRKANGYA